MVRLALERTKLSEEKEQLQQQAKSEAKWTKFFTEATPYIYQACQAQDILKATVREVRRLLNCDRVVVYSLNQDNYRKIIAESVAPGWIKTLGQVIEDTCFELNYIEKYQYGYVKAIDNIAQAGLDQCYRQQLEQLAVKANVVTSILYQDNLFGLLVAHQCSQPRSWKQYEVRWLAQIGLQVGFALTNSKLLNNANHLQQQAKRRNKWMQSLKKVILALRQHSEQADILETTVKEARQILNCDRIVVYGLTQDQYGEVIAESVVSGWTQALGQVIHDPCFEFRYIEKYQNGRVTAIDNIYEAGVTSCYLEQLEKLEVKANLITPILTGGKVFGLLVAHHCYQTHKWQSGEIEFLSQLAIDVGLELEKAELIAERNRLQQQAENETKWTQLFTQTVQSIRQSLSQEDIFHVAVEEIHAVLSCDRVVIYSLNQDQYGEVIAESVTPGWTKALGQVIHDPCFEFKYLEKYQNGRVTAIDNIYEAGITLCYLEQLEKLEVKANLVTPILTGGKIFGLLVAHQCSQPRIWQQYEIRWLTQLSTQVGFALENAQLLQQLEQSSLTANYLVHEHYLQTHELKQQLIQMLGSSTNTHETLAQDALTQSENFIQLLHQVEEINDAVQQRVVDLKQLGLQQQQHDSNLQVMQESMNLTLDNIVELRDALKETTIKMNHLSHSSQKFLEIVHLIQDLSKQIAQQSLNITIAISRTTDQEQDSIFELTDTLLSSVQQLYKVIAQINPLLTAIDTEACKSKISIDSALHQAVNGTALVQDIEQKLEAIANANATMSSLVNKATNAAESQTMVSASTEQLIQNVIDLSHQISQHSLDITDSFSQLAELTRKL